jgi:hypothetical protein
MVTKKDLFIAVLATFCLTATILMVIPIRSSINSYDPWLDYNDDGKIGLSDLVSLANSYGTTGDPTKQVNVTNWEIDCYHKYSVNIVVDLGNASEGNTEPVTFYVHVTYQEKSVIWVNGSNFYNYAVDGPLGAHPSAHVEVYYLNYTGTPGVFKYVARPFLGYTWLHGTYIQLIGLIDPYNVHPPIYAGEEMVSYTIPP